MSDGSSHPDSFRSPKRARTIPLSHCDESDTSNVTSVGFDRRSTTLGVDGKIWSSTRHPPNDLDDEATANLAKSTAAIERSCPSQHKSEIPANESSGQIPSSENDPSDAPGEDNEADAPPLAKSSTSRNEVEGSFHGPSDRLVLQSASAPPESAHEPQATGPLVDESASHNGKRVSVTPSTEDSDSIYRYFAGLDADERALILANDTRPALSVEELLALPMHEDVSLEDELGPWSAPSETTRPPNPYKKGQKLMIQKHKACAPFGHDYADYPGLREVVNERDLRTKTLVEICLEHPPMDGETAVDDPPLSLHIIDEIRVKEDGGAQLVVCRLDDELDDYVAKIFDPLYYGFSDRMWSDTPRDVTNEADRDYCREVAAYLELDERFGGRETPKYYGSWTFSLPIDLPDGRKTRNIRLILMERIKGDTMSEMDPPPYTEDVRLEALAQTLEAFNRIHAAGVIHRDVAQRNVMICNGTEAGTFSRVVIIDFNFAVVIRLAKWERSSKRQGHGLPEKPRNPIDDWWDCGGLYSDFAEWLPASWDQMYKPMREWLYARWGKSSEFRPHKEPLIWENEED